MIKLINGYTKAKVMEKIRKYNNGTKCIDTTSYKICEYENKSKDNRCFVGCFIPDYHPALGDEGPASAIIPNYEDLKCHMPLSIKDLERFQECHDNNVREDDMYSVAQKWLDANVEE